MHTISNKTNEQFGRVDVLQERMTEGDPDEAPYYCNYCGGEKQEGEIQ